ncbi:MAG: histone deacetylase family protein [Hyphomicrobiaceae bacterium]
MLAAKGARGLLLDVPPAEASKLKDLSRLSVNRQRLRFYARYDVQKVAGTLWDVEPNPRNEGYLTTLLYDPLGRRPRLARRDARRSVRFILVEQYGFEPDDPFVGRIVESFDKDPVVVEPLAGKRVVARPSRGKYIAPLKVVAAELHVIHHLRERGYVARPVRVRQILRGLEGLAFERVPARHFSDEHVTAVHNSHLVDYLKAMSRRLDEKAIVYPEVFPIRRPDRIPRALEDRAGYYCADTFTPLTRNVWPAARHSVDVALTAARLVAEGERFAYALCRPPGHHAERRIYGGFCFLNNAAIAAHYLSRRGKVALLDIDYHHGNGAQDIFYDRSDVLTLSIHGHPSHAYPNFSGYADERGEGEGKGFNRNWPLDPPVDDDRYIHVLEEAIAVARKFDPRFLVVALGFDIMRGDPTGSFSLTTRGLDRIGRRLGTLRYPIVVVQEGGYSVGNLRVGAHAFFEGLASSWY